MNESPISPPTWLITGCSNGFALALASVVLGHGHRVIATARQPSALGDLAARFPETGRVLTLDVTDSSQVKSAVAEAAEAFGWLDVVVNNAGYALVGAYSARSSSRGTSRRTSSEHWKSFGRLCQSSARKGAATS